MCSSKHQYADVVNVDKKHSALAGQSRTLIVPFLCCRYEIKRELGCTVHTRAKPVRSDCHSWSTVDIWSSHAQVSSRILCCGVGATLLCEPGQLCLLCRSLDRHAGASGEVSLPQAVCMHNHACNGTHTASCLYYCVSYHLRVLSILQIVMTTTSILGCFTYMVGAMLSCRYATHLQDLPLLTCPYISCACVAARQPRPGQPSTSGMMLGPRATTRSPAGCATWHCSAHAS